VIEFIRGIRTPLSMTSIRASVSTESNRAGSHGIPTWRDQHVDDLPNWSRLAKADIGGDDNRDQTGTVTRRACLDRARYPAQRKLAGPDRMISDAAPPIS